MSFRNSLAFFLFVVEFDSPRIDPHWAGAINTLFLTPAPHWPQIWMTVLSHHQYPFPPGHFAGSCLGWWPRAPLWPPSTEGSLIASGPHYLPLNGAPCVWGMWAGFHLDRKKWKDVEGKNASSRCQCPETLHPRPMVWALARPRIRTRKLSPWFWLVLLQFCQPPHRALWPKSGLQDTWEMLVTPPPPPSPLPPIDSALPAHVSHGASVVDVRWQTTANPMVATTLNWLLKFKNGEMSQWCGFLASLGDQAGLVTLGLPSYL